MRKMLHLGLLFLTVPLAFPQSGAPARSSMAISPSSSRVTAHPSFGRRPAPLFYPFYLGDYDYGYPAYAPAPNVVIVEQPPAYLVLSQFPPEAPHLEIHEYGPAPPGQTAASPGSEPAAFAIVLKDGSERSAIAVAVQDNTLHYVEPDGRHQRLALDAVDRDATRRRNRERNLELQLPASDR